MDLIGEEEGRLERLSAWLEASRAEMIGLALLLVGAVVASAALWWTVAAVDPGVAEVHDADTTAGPHPASTETVSPSDAEAVDHDHGGGGQEADDADLTVHVTGAVGDPGVVTVPAGARVSEAIAAAGDATDEAQLERLNLARPVRDGEQVHVPQDGEELPPEATRPDGGTNGGDGPIDLNHADAAALERLPGIGPSRAAAIIEHREAHGPFEEPGDLRDVSGIGEATFQRLAEQVTTS
jgi:competence protein ComEA